MEAGMKKIFPLLFALITMLTGCSLPNIPAQIEEAWKIAENTKDSILYLRSNGYLYTLLIIEGRTNLSSRYIDKTKPKKVYFNTKALKSIDEYATFYVLPAKITRSGETYYDTEFSNLIRNYIFITGRGDITTNLNEADYVITMEIEESVEKFYGTNDSTLNIVIHNKLDLPVFYTAIQMKSSSDANFWYQPTRKARKVKQLTLLSLDQLMEYGLPIAFGDYVRVRDKMKNQFKIWKKQHKEALEKQFKNREEKNTPVPVKEEKDA